MNSRMDRYNNQVTDVPKRSDKNQDLYRRVNNTYDEFENLVIPSNTREINVEELKREVINREEYREKKNDEVRYKGITNEKKEEQIYDIKELLDKVNLDNKPNIVNANNLSSGDYLKKLKLDDNRTNIELVKEQFEEIKKDESLEDESLLRTANLSLEILSDLKSSHDETIVTDAIIDEEDIDNEDDMVLEKVKSDKDKEEEFYSNKYKFNKDDFYSDDASSDEDDFFSDRDMGHGKLFLKIFLLILGIVIVVGTIIFLINYFGRV